MIGEQVIHRLSGTWGVIDGMVRHPDGRIVVRLNDRWFFAADTQPSWWP